MKKWTKRLRARFAGREPLPLEEAIRLYWSGPDDPLDLLFTPAPTRGPLEWLFFHGMTEDRQSELEYRLKRRGVDARGVRVCTIGDYVSLWARGG